jgi:predicted peroxiredoxin
LTSYLLVESRSDLESPDVVAQLRLAATLRGGGHDVRLFLIQNAVLMTGRVPLVADLARLGVPVLVDGYSSATRGIGGDRLGPGVAFAAMADLVGLAMTPGVVTVWH